MTFLGKWLGGNKNKGDVFPSPPPLRTEQASGTQAGRRHVPGDKIANRYQVAKVLVGGMGVVYLCADHAEDGCPVALKTFKPKYLPDRAARDRFLRFNQLPDPPALANLAKRTASSAVLAPEVFGR
jgi:hypothetical protein